jgi:3-phosphoshikimate 1-carboxyvinyltransferase
MEVAPLATFRSAAIDTYDDHRMAMCFALAALGGAGVTINDPGCVRKTFPGYFDALARISVHG